MYMKTKWHGILNDLREGENPQFSKARVHLILCTFGYTSSEIVFSSIVVIVLHLASPFCTLFTAIDKSLLASDTNEGSTNKVLSKRLKDEDENLHNFWVLPWTFIWPHATALICTRTSSTQELRQLTSAIEGK